jgi:oxygen-independent coproporphyrinogen-3 oxidase
VSAYSLTIEPGTQFGELWRRGRLPVANEDVVADAFFAIEEALGSAGLSHYEISNYARPGDEARHNLGYWRGHDYLGLGCAAFGTLSGPDGAAVRYRNGTDPARYMRSVLSGELAVESEEPLDGETRLRERIMLGLRLREGFDLEEAAAALGVPAWTEARRSAAERLQARGKLVIEGGHVRVPRDAWVLADGIAAELF